MIQQCTDEHRAKLSFNPTIHDNFEISATHLLFWRLPPRSSTATIECKTHCNRRFLTSTKDIEVKKALVKSEDVEKA